MSHFSCSNTTQGQWGGHTRTPIRNTNLRAESELQGLAILLNPSLLAVVNLMVPNVITDKDEKEGVLYITFEKSGSG